MKLISLENVMQILKDEGFHYEKIDGAYGKRPIAIYNCKTRIEMELPTISPVEIIEEEIKILEDLRSRCDEHEYSFDRNGLYSAYSSKISSFGELLQKFKSLS